MDINLELLQSVLLRGHDAEHFRRLSRQLFISQSAVSQAVKNLAKKAGPYSVCAQHQTGHPDSGGRASSPACKAGPFHAKRGRGCPFRRRKSYRSAADRCQRYSVPLFSHPLSPPFPQGSSGGTDQDHQQYLHRMCGTSGKRPG